MQLVEAFPVDGAMNTQIGVVVFSDSANLEFALNTYSTKEQVCSAINSIPYVGTTTNTPEGLRVTRNECFSAANGDRPDAENFAIIITDGVPYPNNLRDTTIQEAQLLINSGRF